MLDRLCQKVSWPSDLFVPAGDHMERRETSRAQTPFYFSHPAASDPRRPIGELADDRRGARLSCVLPGAGARRNHATAAQFGSTGGSARARSRSSSREFSPRRARRGYGTRDPAFTGGNYGIPPTDDGLAAIAVPLLDRTRVHGSINILWIRTALTIEECAARHLADLKAAAAEIVASLHARPRRPWRRRTLGSGPLIAPRTRRAAGASHDKTTGWTAARRCVRRRRRGRLVGARNDASTGATTRVAPMALT